VSETLKRRREGVAWPVMRSMPSRIFVWSSVKSTSSPGAGTATSATRSFACSRSTNLSAFSMMRRAAPNRMLPWSTMKRMARPGASPPPPLLEMPVSSGAAAATGGAGRCWLTSSGSTSLMYSADTTLRGRPSTSTWKSAEVRSTTWRPSRSTTVTSMGSTSMPVRNTGWSAGGCDGAGGGVGGGVGGAAGDVCASSATAAMSAVTGTASQRSHGMGVPLWNWAVPARDGGARHCTYAPAGRAGRPSGPPPALQLSSRVMPVRDVLIVGAGPSGLATAIACRHHGLDYQVLEQGALVDAIARFPTNMVFFTTPELLEIGGIPLTTPYEKPTRAEALRYYRKVTDVFDLRVALHERVLAVAPEPHGGEPAFAVATRTRLGVERVRHARAVVLAMGYYDRPVMLGVPGEDLPHVSHYYSEAHPYYRQRVVIVGGKNSACEAALELHRNGGQVTLVHRGPALGDSVKYWVRPDMENRILEGSIAARFNTRVVEIRPTDVVVESGTVRETLPAESVLLLTGYRADPDFLRGIGVRVDAETLVPSHDPQTFETNVPNLFIAGGQLAGVRTGTIFIENGRFHGERIAQVIAGRIARH
jgi:thioredoxin reductase (NADPH)